MTSRLFAPAADCSTIAGADIPGVHTFTRLQDALAIEQHPATQVNHAIVVGGG